MKTAINLVYRHWQNHPFALLLLLSLIGYVLIPWLGVNNDSAVGLLDAGIWQLLLFSCCCFFGLVLLVWHLHCWLWQQLRLPALSNLVLHFKQLEL